MAERYPQRPDMRGVAPGNNSPESDPLAELARLIGQTDPFGTMGRANARAPQPAQQAEPHSSQEQDAGTESGRPAWLRNLPQYRDEQDTPDQHASGAFDAHAETGWHQPQHAQEQDPSRYDNVLYGQGQDPYAQQQAQYPQGYQEAQYPQGYQSGYQQDAQAHEQYAQGQPQYAQDQYAQQGQFDPGQLDAYPYRAEEEEPVEVDKRKAGMVTALVVLGFAVVGTAGAFAFKSYVMSPRSGDPPVIHADASPTKIAPAGGSDPGKINDRVAGNSERLVPREEQPVDVRDQTKARIVFPPTNQAAQSPANANAAFSAADARSSAAVPAPSSSTNPADEPKRLKTIPIRNNNAGAPTPAVTASPGSQPAPPAKRVATTPAAPPASTNSTGGRAANPPDSNLPMAITPGRQSSAPDNARVAAVQPSSREPEPTASSGYVVQLSSQPSESEARSSFRTYQSKFPSVMNGRQPIIKRVDFGAKGVWYRAQTGPFASSEDASSFCKSLTAAGGNCIVQRN